MNDSVSFLPQHNFNQCGDFGEEVKLCLNLRKEQTSEKKKKKNEAGQGG